MNWPEAFVIVFTFPVFCAVALILLAILLDMLTNMYWQIRLDMTWNSIIRDIKKIAEAEVKEKKKR